MREIFDPTARKPGALPVSAIDAVAASIIFVTAFLSCLILASKFSQAGIFLYYDILFDADPNARISGIAHGWSSGESFSPSLPNASHAFFSYYFSILIRVVARLWLVVGSVEMSVEAFREMLALAVSPILSGLSAIFLFASLRLIGAGRALAFVLSLFSVFAFSNLIFGSLPDIYACGRFALAGLLLWSTYWVRSAKPVSRRGLAVWAALCLFAIGTTITFAAVGAAALFFATLRPGRFWRGALSAGTATIVLTLGVIGIGQGVEELIGMRQQRLAQPTPAGSYVHRFVSFDIETVAARGAAFLADFAQSIAPTGVQRVPTVSVKIECNVDNVVLKPLERSSLGDLGSSIAILMVIPAFMIAMIAGFFALWRDPSLRYLSYFTAFAILLNFPIHFLIGSVMFLYSQHWIHFVIFLIGAMLIRANNLLRVAFLAIAGIALLLNVAAVSEVYAIGADIAGRQAEGMHDCAQFSKG